MLEEGTLVELKGGKKALVELERKSMCGTCSACSSGIDGKMSIEADNLPGAKPGDQVSLDINTKGLALGIAMTYLLPALGLIFGIIFGNEIFSKLGVGPGQEVFSMLFGLALMFLFFAAARRYGRKKISYSAAIVAVLKKAVGA